MFEFSSHILRMKSDQIHIDLVDRDLHVCFSPHDYFMIQSLILLMKSLLFLSTQFLGAEILVMKSHEIPTLFFKHFLLNQASQKFMLVKNKQQLVNHQDRNVKL